MTSQIPRNFTCPKCQNILRIIGAFRECDHCGYTPPPVKKRSSSNSKKQPRTRTKSGRRDRCPHCLQRIPPGEVEIGQETDGREGRFKCLNCLKWSARHEFMEQLSWTQSACCSYCQSRDGQFVDSVMTSVGIGGSSRYTVTKFACRDCGVAGDIKWLPEKPDDPLPASWTTQTGKASSAKPEVVAQLSELSTLWRSGALSDAEFEAAKKRILGLG